MLSPSLRKQVRLLEVYSMAQGILLVFLAAWLRFGPPALQMQVPPDAANLEQSLKLIAYGLLVFILIAIFALTFVKSKLRQKTLEALREEPSPFARKINNIY